MLYTFQRQPLRYAARSVLLVNKSLARPSSLPLRTQGETETDLTGDELCERAVVGLKAAIFPGLLEALEAGADEAEKENQRLKALLKNCFDAPAPPEGTTGGEDGKYFFQR